MAKRKTSKKHTGCPRGTATGSAKRPYVVYAGNMRSSLAWFATRKSAQAFVACMKRDGSRETLRTKRTNAAQRARYRKFWGD